MHTVHEFMNGCWQSRGKLALAVALLHCCVLLPGCAAMTNPLVDGVPVHRLPPGLLATSKDDMQTIPLPVLEQPRPAAYLLAPGDTLAVYIEGVLGERTQQVPVNGVLAVQVRDQRSATPTLGYPVPVRDDGTVTLPFVAPITVQGLTVPQAQDAIAVAYRQKGILKPGAERIYVNLLQARHYQVLVLRQEATTYAPGPDGAIISSKLGTGNLVELPAYENDVLHALTVTGGLPGLDAVDAVIIERGCFSDPAQCAVVQKQLSGLPPGSDLRTALGCEHPIIRIPLRTHCGEPMPIRPEDVILHTGDVVFVEYRVHDVYFTGGLLPAAEHVLPRDRDLDVVEAVTQAHGPLINGAFAVNNLAGNLIQPGLGGPNPSHLTVIRKTPNGGQVPIRVDLNKALKDRRERILVKAGDVLILQETPGEAMARYFTQTFANFDLFWQVIHTKYATGAIDVAAPDRLPGRIAVENITPGQ